MTTSEPGADTDADAVADPPVRRGARAGALLAVRITEADVGRRVSVRHRYDASTLTDVVGLLLSWEASGSDADPGAAAVLRIERRDGSVAEVPVADVVAAKVVPPAPARRTTA